MSPAGEMEAATAHQGGENRGEAVWAIIPARNASVRFPGKPLVSIAGKPMIRHVYERVGRTAAVERVLVATDDEEIAGVVRDFGGEAVLTSPEHPTGTDRVAEALELARGEGGGPGWVLNVQGDEPLIDRGDLATLIEGMKASAGGVLGTLIYPLKDEAELEDPNIVKAVLDNKGRALYFSRAPIPYPRGGGGLGWRHLGVYLFRADFLPLFAGLPPSRLAGREELEQLRALEHGYPIHCFEAANLTVGVDIPGDVARAEALLSEEPPSKVPPPEKRED